MLLGLTYQLIRFIAALVLVRTRSDAQLRAEVLTLRHQLRVLERRVGKPAWQPGDRLLLVALSRLLPRSGWSALLPRPETLLRWHRETAQNESWYPEPSKPDPLEALPSFAHWRVGVTDAWIGLVRIHDVTEGRLTGNDKEDDDDGQDKERRAWLASHHRLSSELLDQARIVGGLYAWPLWR